MSVPRSGLLAAARIFGDASTQRSEAELLPYEHGVQIEDLLSGKEVIRVSRHEYNAELRSAFPCFSTTSRASHLGRYEISDQGLGSSFPL